METHLKTLLTHDRLINSQPPTPPGQLPARNNFPGGGSYLPREVVNAMSIEPMFPETSKFAIGTSGGGKKRGSTRAPASAALAAA